MTTKSDLTNSPAVNPSAAASIVANLIRVGLKPYAGRWRGELQIGVAAPEPVGFGDVQMVEMTKLGAWLKDHPDRREEFARATKAVRL